MGTPPHGAGGELEEAAAELEATTRPIACCADTTAASADRAWSIAIHTSAVRPSSSSRSTWRHPTAPAWSTAAARSACW